MPDEPTEFSSPAAAPRRRRFPIDWFLGAMCGVAMAVIGGVAGGYVLVLLTLGLGIAGAALLAAWPLRRSPFIPWLIGLGVSLTLSYIMAMSLIYASYDAICWRVFDMQPPHGTRFVTAQRSVAFSEGAAMVIIDGVNRAELEPLLASGRFTRDTRREQSIALAGDPREALRDLASGTTLLADVTPTPQMEIYQSRASPDRVSYVVYFPSTGRMYVFYLDH